MIEKTGFGSRTDRKSGEENIVPAESWRQLASRVSPRRILIITLAAIIVAEVVAMIVIAWLPPTVYALVTLLDVLIMISLIYPVLYRLIFRSLFVHIAERERAESRLILLSAALKAAANGVFITSIDGAIQWANPSFTEITGYTLDEVLGQNPRLFKSNQQDAKYYHQMWQTILSGEVWHSEIINRHKDGSLYHEEQIITPLINDEGEITNFIVIQQDISERKQAEQALRHSEALLRNVLENLPVGVWIIDKDGQILHGNPASQQIWAGAKYVGIEQYGEYKAWWLDSGEPVAPEEWAASRAITHRETILDEEVEIECFDGTHKIILNSAVPFLDEQNAIQGVIVVNQDITERKRSEQALLYSNELLERYFSSIYTLIAYMDRDFNFIRVNETYARSDGRPAEFFIGKNHFDLYPHEENQAIFQRVVDTGEPFSVFEKPFEYPEAPERGVTYWDWSLQPVKEPDGTVQGVVLSLVDVTNRKMAEIRLARQNQALFALTEAERKQRQVAESLVQSVVALTTSLQFEDVLNTILDQIRRSVPFRGADIVLLEGNTLRMAGYHGFEDMPDSIAAMQRTYALDDFPLYQRICSLLQPVLISDTQKEAEWRVAPGMEWVRSYLAAPLVSDGKVSGIINLTSDQPGFFNQEMAEHMLAFAAPAALALRNAQLYRAETTAHHVAETLSTAARALTQTLDLDQISHTLLEHIDAILHPDTSGVALLEGKTRLASRAVLDHKNLTDPNQILSIVIDTDSSPPLQNMMLSRQSILIPDTATFPNWRGYPGLEHIHCWLGVPLVAGDNVIGVVGLGKREAGYFTPTHVQWAEALAGQAAMTIQNAWLFEQVRASSERLQGLSHRLVEVQENERRYIASELHDEVGQALTSLMVGLQLIEKKAGQPEAVRAEVTEMGQVLETVIGNLHRLAMDLRPASLDHLGLEAALRQHVEMLNEKLNMEVSFAMTDIHERLPSNIEISFYRIVQEALNNVIRHARATQVDVLITHRDDNLALIIEDNGIGFTPDEAIDGKRMGLIGMRERAEMLDGKFVIESIPGQGSTLLVEVPYARSYSHR